MTNEAKAKISVAGMGNTRALGHRLTEETKKKISASHIGLLASPETRSRMSTSARGKIMSPETRARMSIAKKNISPETRAKMSVAQKGKKVSPEACAKMSAADKGRVVSPETRIKLSGKIGPLSPRWRGGPRVYNAKNNAKRRTLGFIPLNTRFEGCEGHHINAQDVIYMPKALHRSVFHRQTDGLGMAKINAIAYSFLSKQEAEAVTEERAA